MNDNAEIPTQAAEHLFRLWQSAPETNEDGERIPPCDYVEFALWVARQGEGQYKTATIKRSLSDENAISAPTKLPPSAVTLRSEQYKHEGELRTAPTKWEVAGWVEKAERMLCQLKIEPTEAAALTEEAMSERQMAEKIRNETPSALKKKLRARKNSSSPTHNGSNDSGTEDGHSHARQPRGNKDRCTSNGCDTQLTGNRENRRSEGSDRQNGGGHERSKRARHKPDRQEFESRGTRAQRQFLDRRVRTPAERLLFLHLLGYARQVSYSASGEDEWNTVPADILEKKMGAPYHSTYRVWKDSDLIEAYQDGHYVIPTSDRSGRAREFKIPGCTLERWHKLGTGSKRWWLHTQEPKRTCEPQPMSTDLSDENNNGLPDLVGGALRVLKDADHRVKIEPIEEAIDALAGYRSKTARAQRTGLQFSLETIKQQAVASEGSEARLRNAYEMTFGGRIIFKSSGPQGLMGPVKALAYDIEGYRNFDIESCHTTGLKQVADKLARIGVDIDISPWEQYPGKDEVVTDTGLPRILVKTVEHAIKYGAVLPASLAQVKNFYVDEDEDENDVSNWPAIAQAAEKHAVNVDEALGKLNDVFSNMRRVIKEIAEALLDEYWKAYKQPGGPAGYCMKNACGVTFRPSDYDEGHERQTKVMAWMLQGLEAAFIHSVTILSSEYDEFSVLANEHDGLIIRKEIDDEKMFEKALQEAIEDARPMSGFGRAELVEKPHADEDDVVELYRDEDDQKPEETQTAPHETRSRNPSREAIAKASDEAARWNAQRDIPQYSEDPRPSKKRPPKAVREESRRIAERRARQNNTQREDQPSGST